MNFFIKDLNTYSSNDDLKPSTVISEQSPTGLIARHIKTTGLESASHLTCISGK